MRVDRIGASSVEGETINAVRYYLALLLIISLPTRLLFWLLIHPFVHDSFSAATTLLIAKPDPSAPNLALGLISHLLAHRRPVFVNRSSELE